MTIQEVRALAAVRLPSQRLPLLKILLVVGGLAVAPYVLHPMYLMKLYCFALFACSFNLLQGYGGLMSFGHAAFFGMGSYVAGHAAKIWGAPPEVAIFAGALLGLVLGVVFGAIAIRRQGIYFAMITMALGQMVYFYCNQVPWTGGEDGLQQIPRGKLMGIVSLSSDLTLYWVVATVFGFSVFFIYRIVNSPFGRVLDCVRGNESRALSLGYRVGRYKLIAFTLSATFAGLAGAMKALVMEIASLTDVHGSMSGEVVLMTLVGGLGTMLGPIVGAFVVVTMQTYLATLGDWVLVIQGTIFIVCVLLFRQGIVGLAMEAIAWTTRLGKKRDQATRASHGSE